MADVNALLGQGLNYPFAWSATTGGAQAVSEVDSVRASLRRLFDTAPGEDFMNPGYGCALKQLVFETDTAVLRALADNSVRRAVALWEPRIAEVLRVDIISPEPNSLQLSVYFRLIQSATIDNLVTPLTVGG
jgi:uncharacterized protein